MSCLITMPVRLRYLWLGSFFAAWRSAFPVSSKKRRYRLEGSMKTGKAAAIMKKQPHVERFIETAQMVGYDECGKETTRTKTKPSRREDKPESKKLKPS